MADKTFVKSNAQYMGIDTTEQAETVTLDAVVAKEYQVANIGTGGNIVQVNFGLNSLVVAEGEYITALYDGAVWSYNANTGGSPGEATDLANPTYVQNQGILIPLYVYPTDVRNNTEWNNVIEVKKAHPTVPTTVIVNPSTGPGAVVDENFTVGIKRLQNANIKVIGYVSTNYGDRDSTLVKGDIDTWTSLYPGIEGAFFDEVPFEGSVEDLAYYKDINTYATEAGLVTTVGNAGAPFNTEYYTEDIFSIIVGWESDTYPSLEQAKEDFADGASEFNYLKRAILLHSQTTFDDALYTEVVKPYYGWQYITNDVMDNPWDSVSAYLAYLFEQLDSAGETTTDVPNTYTFKYDTTGGDVTLTQSAYWTPESDPALNLIPFPDNAFLNDGDILEIWNSGLRTSNNGLLGGYQMDTHRIGPSCKVAYLVDKDNGVMAFKDLGQVVDRYHALFDGFFQNIVKYASGEMINDTLVVVIGDDTDNAAIPDFSFSEGFNQITTYSVSGVYGLPASNTLEWATDFTFNLASTITQLSCYPTRTGLTSIRIMRAEFTFGSSNKYGGCVETKGYWKDPDTIS